ncbi:helix-turn-helix domain-containing protein [Pseudobacillus badius]|uniref:helix-turn-helix domain-containing protein n=1 Tax=Bacillus badius TaxID=1455 RepID=UPI0007B0B18D|nr:helix-turn-helix transcriptional regulator [Bacillus badius]KZN99847.1 hypothetical protein A4244_17815 [Bacillus badius]OCS85951.1 hypothetical protein A6M11_17830 [Bacillus badius]OVE51689.1 transcriptional regulator [Bacillus badius]TDW03103.1 hypothetical protein B0G66_1045 [Bacillus badius]
MTIKPSAEVGEAVRHLLAEKDMTNEQMADDLNISKQLVSHYKNDRRTMQQDIAKQSIRVYEDSPKYIGELLYKFSDGYIPPVLKGPAIERHMLALKAHAEKGLAEALTEVGALCLAKPPGMADEEEKESIAQMMDKLLEARMFIDNFMMAIERDYGIPMKKGMKRLVLQWKANRWLA